MKNKRLNVFLLISALCIILFAGCTTVDDNIINNNAEEIAVNAPITEEITQNTEVSAELPKAELQKTETDEKPVLTEPESTTENTSDDKPTDNNVTPEKNFCTLSVECKIVLSNMDKLKKEKQSCVPEDGIIFAEKMVEFTSGESVFDVLLREMKNSKIHMDFTETPLYKSMYIKGINNLYEFDCGELSGWTYRVNGKIQSVGCSQCILKPGDTVEWIYSCDLGRDID